VAAFAGIVYSGNCYAPLDIKAPLVRNAAILKNLAPSRLITDLAHVGELVAAGYDAHSMIVLEELLPPVQATAEVAHRYSRNIDTDPVYVIHTSGSTGVPKGVAISHRGVIDYIEWALETYSIDEEAVIGSQAPFHFDNSTLDLYLCFAAGATLVLVPEENYLFPAKLLEYLNESGVNFIFWVPSVLVAIANMDLLSQLKLPALKHILFAGEVMPTRHLNYWRKWFPRALFSNLYGPTEITVDCTYYIVNRELAEDEPVPIGFPCRNSDVLILNEQNQLASPGERGELCVRGSSLALGYWNDPEKTAIAFCQNPIQTHYPERIYRTGDIVYTNQHGEIIFAGRNDGQVKHMGYLIELGEIETAVMSLPELRNACVLYDRGQSRIVLIYESDTPLDIGVLRTSLGKIVPKYMVPTSCVWMPQMPLNSNGKIDRQQLATQLGERAI
jgi:amino acid adenylation domain-containing protein